MLFNINDAKVACACMKYSQSCHSVRSMKYCETCKTRKCLFCTLQNVKSSSCGKCSKEYNSDESYCSRCYVCPKCNADLVTSQYLYKLKEGTMDTYELIRKREDKDKYIGKSVTFKCACGYKFSTGVGKKEQKLQEIVMEDVKTCQERRYDELVEYYKWVLNYHRIEDKKAQIRWKSEIMEMFSHFEISKVLKNEYIDELNKRREEIIKSRDDSIGGKYPVPKRLTKKFSQICVSCLSNVSNTPLSEKIPVVYTMPMIGFSFEKVKNLDNEETCDVPILLSIMNEGVQAKVEYEDIGFELNSSQKLFGDIPTCLLSQVKGNVEECKLELSKRDPSIFSKLSYREGTTVKIIEQGTSWSTLLINVTIGYKQKEFEIQLTFNDEFINYRCHL